MATAAGPRIALMYVAYMNIGLGGTVCSVVGAPLLHAGTGMLLLWPRRKIEQRPAWLGMLIVIVPLEGR